MLGCGALARQANVLALQDNLATTYESLGRHEQALRMSRDVYSGRLKLGRRAT